MGVDAANSYYNSSVNARLTREIYEATLRDAVAKERQRQAQIADDTKVDKQIDGEVVR